MMTILVCLSLLGYCLALSRVSKWPVEAAPFFVISSMITLLYIFAYCNILKIGADGVLILGGLLLVASPFYLKNHLNHIEKIIKPGFIVSLLFIILFLWLSSQVHFSGFDEFTQWGPHSKFVFYNNGFISATDITIHKSYPLGGALFQYLFFRVSGFGEGTAYVAQCLLIMAPLSILVQNYQWSNVRKTFIAYFSALLALLLLKVQIGPTDSLYMDSAVGVYFGMSLVAYLSSAKNISNILYLIPVIAAFVLFKQKLMPFVLIISAIILFDQIYYYRSKNIITRMFSVALLPITAWLVTQSWHDYLNKINAGIEWKINFSFLTLHTLTSKIIIINYIHALRPALLFIILIFLINLISYYCYQLKNKKINLVLINIILLFGFIAYITGLLLLYLFSFTTYEAVHHASMGRYLGIYEIGWALTALYFLINAVKETKFFKFEIVAIISLIIGFSGLLTIHFMRGKNPEHKLHSIWTLRQPVIQIAEAVKTVTRPDSKIFTIWQASDGLFRGMLVYELTPRKPNLGCTNFGAPHAKQDIWTCNASPENFLKQLRGFDYLLLAYSDNDFWSHYQSVMPNKQKIKPLIAYQICKGAEFLNFGQPGCVMRTENAYLFKIVNKNNHIQLINIAKK